MLEIILAILLIVFVVISMVVVFNKSGNVFTPWFIFTALSVVDVYIPALLRMLSEDLNIYPIWMEPLENWDIASGFIFYFIGWVIFTIGYFSLSKGEVRSKTTYILNLKKALLVLLLCCFFYFIYFILSVQAHGGGMEYLTIKLSERFRNSFELPSYFVYLESLRVIALSLIFITTANIFTSDYAIKNIPRGRYVFIFLGVSFAITTLFRGTILNYFVGLGALMILSSNFDFHHKFKMKKISKNIMISMVLMFLVVGGYRTLFINSNVEDKKSVDYSLLAEVNKNLSGSSLLGVSSIIKYYNINDEHYFYGKTIKDMFLMPIPRAIYPSKPEWYGIDDITKRMGWPESSQSATTPQGEFFANFGYFGIILMGVLGAIYGRFFLWALNSQLNLSVYSFIILPSIFTTFWMSTTGFVNSLKFILIIYLIVLFIFDKKVNRG